MKIKLYHSECSDCGRDEWDEGNEGCSDPVVEVPDAIIAEWRELTARLAEIEEYFDEQVTPQIEAEYKRRHEEWRRAHPEEAKRQDAIAEIWGRTLLKQLSGDGLEIKNK